MLTPSYLAAEQDAASLTIRAAQTQGVMCVGYIHSLLLAEHPGAAVPRPPHLRTPAPMATSPPAPCRGDVAQPHRSPVLLGAMW